MGRSDRWETIRASVPLVAPSILACDFLQLGRQIEQLQQAGIKILHIDVMDGHFVPNISFGIPIVQAIRRATDMVLDVHLMITSPERFVQPFVEAGADAITFHLEATRHPEKLLEQIRSYDIAAGVSIKPATSARCVLPYLELCDLVLVMSVEPGFGGQKFMPVALEKLQLLNTQKPSHVVLSVDGGINEQTIAPCAAVGAEIFVIGTAFFCTDNFAERRQQFENLIAPVAERRK